MTRAPRPRHAAHKRSRTNLAPTPGPPTGTASPHGSRAAANAGEIRPDVDAYELLRAVGNLCVGIGNDSHYDAHHMVGLLITGLGRPKATIHTQANPGKRHWHTE
jgi:hypothetical protein